MRRTSRAAQSPSRPFRGPTPDQAVQHLLQAGESLAAVLPPVLDGARPSPPPAHGRRRGRSPKTVQKHARRRARR